MTRRHPQTTADGQETPINGRLQQQVARTTLALTAVLGTLLLAACGSARKPQVATLGATQTGTTTPKQRSPRVSASAYAACMTAHGIAMAPPTSRQGLTILGITAPGSPQFKAAERACRAFEPTGSPPPPTPAQQVQAAQALTRFAACMRNHDVPNFPDPNGQGVFPEAQVEALDTNTPFFQRALEACDRLYPHSAIHIGFPGGSHT
jgi:hypothetical protein